MLVEKYGQVRPSSFLHVCIAFTDLNVSVEARVTQARKWYWGDSVGLLLRIIFWQNDLCYWLYLSETQRFLRRSSHSPRRNLEPDLSSLVPMPVKR